MTEKKKTSTFDLAIVKSKFDEYLYLTGGELDEEQEKQLELVENALIKKADDAHYVMGLLKAHADFLKDEGQSLIKQAKVLENGHSRLKNRIFEAVQVAGDLIGNTVAFGKKKNPPKLIITNEQAIPDSYKSQIVIYEIDKTKLKADLKEGKEVPGAHLEQGESLKVGRPKP